MKNKLSFSMFFLFTMLVSAMLVLNQCKKSKNETNISAHGENESHNMGNNCMNCHKSGGDGEGWFTIAGTVFGNPGNGFVAVYSDTNSTAIHTIEIDANGNFFTTDDIDFSGGLFFKIVSQNGVTKTMPQSVSSGACNQCHGSNAPQLNL